MQEAGKLIINLGLILVFIGIFIWLLGKLPFVGKLPGDIVIKKENFSFYAPLGTMLFLSFLLSLVFTIISSIKK